LLFPVACRLVSVAHWSRGRAGELGRSAAEVAFTVPENTVILFRTAAGGVRLDAWRNDMVRLVLMIVMFAGALGGGHARPADKTAETELEGKWEAVSLVVDGEEPIEENKKLLKGQQIEFRGGKLIFLRDGKPRAGGATVRIDPTTTPKQIDMTYDPSDGKGLGGPTVNGIYKLEGDTLTICYAGRGEDRPTEFASRPGTKGSLSVQRRVK
jgi:uncharacterized protein (TIGR03067 family)